VLILTVSVVLYDEGNYICTTSSRQIHDTQLQGTVPEEVCLLRNKNLNSEDADNKFFKADCSPDNETNPAFIECDFGDCCNTCCDHTTQVCIIDK
jgi:hypothetical protein